MSLNVAIWNIQNYGREGDADSWQWGANSGLRNEFIATFAQVQDLDILFLEEVSTWAAGTLRDLQTKLNGVSGGEWAVSYCGGALRADLPGEPQDENDVVFAAGARSEGYAVCWRTDRAAKFTLVNPAVEISKSTFYSAAVADAHSPLGMVTTGRPTDHSQSIEPIGRLTGKKRPLADLAPQGRVTGGYLPPAAYACEPAASGRGYQEVNPWRGLDFPVTAKNGGKEMRRTLTRRPVYVVVELANAALTDAQRYIPVSAYHAPSTRNLAQWGALMAGLSREVYVAEGPRGLTSANRIIFGGDFNCVVDDREFDDDEPGNYYANFTRAFEQAETGGANCLFAPPVPRRMDSATTKSRATTVTLTTKTGPKTVVGINSSDPLEYLTLPIDLIFYRRVAGDTGFRDNLYETLRTARNNYAPVVKRFQTHLAGRQTQARLALRTIQAGGAEVPNEVLRFNTSGPWNYVYKTVAGSNRKQWVQQQLLTGGWGEPIKSWSALLADMKNGYFGTPRRAAEFYRIFVSDHLPVVAQLQV